MHERDTVSYPTCTAHGMRQRRRANCGGRWPPQPVEPLTEPRSLPVPLSRDPKSTPSLRYGVTDFGLLSDFDAVAH